MRLPKFPSGIVLRGLVGAGPDHQGPATDPLVGTWSATRWQYTRRAPPHGTVDVVCDLEGSVTLSLSAGTWVLTCDVAGRGQLSIGGTWTVRESDLALLPQGTDAPVEVGYRLGRDELTIHAEESSWDFDGQGRDDAASFVAVFLRL